ncbi:MAG: IclR family transcriptional regulator [Opitutaceae bacterium]|jgi:DNA-binding IclR family transcriptional regulator|nr:IclR family transcriptional regulator [Opitutaceae bacterium]
MIQSVEKALRLLQALDTEEWMGVRELSRRLKITPPTTHNMLQTLRAMSFVEYNATSKQYRLGLAAIRLGAGGDPLNRLRIFARPYIEKLAREFDETVAVFAWLDDQMIAVDWIQANHPLVVTHNHGVIEHPILLAAGRVLLAYQDRAVQLRYAARESLGKLGANCPADTGEMLQMLDAIKREGFAMTNNVADSGIAAVATPVFDASHHLLLGIGCSEPISRSTELHLENVKKLLIEETARMTRQFGGPFFMDRLAVGQ